MLMFCSCLFLIADLPLSQIIITTISHALNEINCIRHHITQLRMERIPQVKLHLGIADKTN